MCIFSVGQSLSSQIWISPSTSLQLPGAICSWGSLGRRTGCSPSAGRAHSTPPTTTTPGQPRGRTDVASLRGRRSRADSKCPRAPRPGCSHTALRRAHRLISCQGLFSYPQPTGQPCGAPDQHCQCSDPQKPCHPYSGPSPCLLLPGEGRAVPTGEGIRSSHILLNFPTQEAGCSRRGSCGLENHSPREGAGREGQGDRAILGTKGDGLRRVPYFLLSSLARQVAASTALMAAARRPPCSRACSP